MSAERVFEVARCLLAEAPDIDDIEDAWWEVYWRWPDLSSDEAHRAGLIYLRLHAAAALAEAVPA